MGNPVGLEDLDEIFVLSDDDEPPSSKACEDIPQYMTDAIMEALNASFVYISGILR